MSIDHVLQNMEYLQKNLLKFDADKGKEQTLSLLKNAYNNELQRLDMYGYNGRAETLKQSYGNWMREFAAGKTPPPMPWRNS